MKTVIYIYVFLIFFFDLVHLLTITCLTTHLIFHLKHLPVSIFDFLFIQLHQSDSSWSHIQTVMNIPTTPPRLDHFLGFISLSCFNCCWTLKIQSVHRRDHRPLTPQSGYNHPVKVEKDQYLMT